MTWSRRREKERDDGIRENHGCRRYCKVEEKREGRTERKEGRGKHAGRGTERGRGGKIQVLYARSHAAMAAMVVREK